MEPARTAAVGSPATLGDGDAEAVAAAPARVDVTASAPAAPPKRLRAELDGFNVATGPTAAAATVTAADCADAGAGLEAWAAMARVSGVASIIRGRFAGGATRSIVAAGAEAGAVARADPAAAAAVAASSTAPGDPARAAAAGAADGAAGAQRNPDHSRRRFA